MAVFTPVAKAELSRWLEQFEVGELDTIEGIAGGIENSNFFVRTSSGEFVLTLFERLLARELPFYLQLIQHLGQHGVPCPIPQAAKDQALFKMLNGKPAALVTRLAGAARLDPGPRECAAMGRTMANMHLAAKDFPIRQPNPRDVGWWQTTLPLVAPHLDVERAEMLTDEVERVGTAYAEMRAHLPSGAVHADLFRDNVLFQGDQLTGVIDFYFAGIDSWLFDVAVAVNDWCIDQDSGALDAPRTQSFLQAYASVRPFTRAEAVAWPWALRAAALRFWLSRLNDIVMPRSAAILKPHDPRHFERIVRMRRAEARQAVVALPH
jgi:homoserine kinase type II